MPNKPMTHTQVNARRRNLGLPPLKICPHCGEGAAEVISRITAGQDGEISETHYCCSYCAKEWVIGRNPYKD